MQKITKPSKNQHKMNIFFITLVHLSLFFTLVASRKQFYHHQMPDYADDYNHSHQRHHHHQNSVHSSPTHYNGMYPRHHIVKKQYIKPSIDGNVFGDTSSKKSNDMNKTLETLGKDMIDLFAKITKLVEKHKNSRASEVERVKKFSLKVLNQTSLLLNKIVSGYGQNENITLTMFTFANQSAIELNKSIKEISGISRKIDMSQLARFIIQNLANLTKIVKVFLQQAKNN